MPRGGGGRGAVVAVFSSSSAASSSSAHASIPRKFAALEMKVEPPKPPDTYPQIKDFEKKFRFPPLTETEKAVVLKASALDDAFRYSGYYLTRKRQKPGMERYSDLYKLIAGKRSIYDELSAMPSKVFPKELRKEHKRRRRDREREKQLEAEWTSFTLNPDLPLPNLLGFDFVDKDALVAPSAETKEINKDAGSSGSAIARALAAAGKDKEEESSESEEENKAEADEEEDPLEQELAADYVDAADDDEERMEEDDYGDNEPTL